MTIDINPDLYAQVPDEHGRFGIYCRKFVAETLMSALGSLNQSELEVPLAGRMKKSVPAMGSPVTYESANGT